MAVYFHVHVLVLVQGGVVNPWLLVQELCQLRVQEVRQLAVVVVVVVGVVVFRITVYPRCSTWCWVGPGWSSRVKWRRVARRRRRTGRAMHSPRARRPVGEGSVVVLRMRRAPGCR